MKTLLLVRHAKSSWDDAAVPDFERPLNSRGKKDAPVMAKRLLEKRVVIDGFYSSPARRARKTAAIFAKEYDREKEEVQLIENLYEAGEDDFYSAVTNADDRFQTIAVFSHNPGITDFANELGTIRTDNIPTGGVFAVRVDADKWSDFKKAKKEFLFFEYPKGGD